jgi:hypothetical protein
MESEIAALLCLGSRQGQHALFTQAVTVVLPPYQSVGITMQHGTLNFWSELYAQSGRDEKCESTKNPLERGMHAKHYS